MANFDVSDDPNFSNEIRKFESTDPAHADLFNNVIQVLLENDCFFDKLIQSLSVKIGNVSESDFGNLQNQIFNISSKYSEIRGYISSKDVSSEWTTSPNTGYYICTGTNNVYTPVISRYGTHGEIYYMWQFYGNITIEKITDKIDKTGSVNDTISTFSESKNRENINSGEKLSVIFGKIKKFFSDLKGAAFRDATDSYDSEGDSLMSGKGVADALSNLSADAPETGTECAVEFIDSIKQEDGKISATKKAIPKASMNEYGIVKMSNKLSEDSKSAATPNLVSHVDGRVNEAESIIGAVYCVTNTLNYDGYVLLYRRQSDYSGDAVIKGNVDDVIFVPKSYMVGNMTIDKGYYKIVSTLDDGRVVAGTESDTTVNSSYLERVGDLTGNIIEELSRLNSDLGFNYYLLNDEDIANTSFVGGLSGIVLYNKDIAIVNISIEMIKDIESSVWVSKNNIKIPQPSSECMYRRYYAGTNGAYFFIQNKGIVIGSASSGEKYSATLIYKRT